MKANKPGSWRPNFRQICWAGAAYFAGCAAYTLHRADQAALPFGQTVVVTGLSLCLGLTVPLAASIIGHETGKGLGALTGQVAAVGYKMAQAKTPERQHKIDTFKKTATTVGKAIGITLALAAGYWGLDQFMRQSFDNSAPSGGGHGRHHASIVTPHHSKPELPDRTAFFAPVPA